MILSVEATSPAKAALVASAGVAGAASSSVLIQQLSLKGVDLSQARFTSALKLDLSAVQGNLIQLRVCDDVNNNGLCSDEASQNVVSLSTPAFLAANAPAAVVIDVFSGRSGPNADPAACEKQHDALMADISGGGYQFVGPDAGIRFPMEASNVAMPTGWVAPGANNAFLVRDAGNTGTVANASQFFDSYTTLKSGATAADGFSALADLDDNGDGVIDANDAAWSSLRLWANRKGDAVAVSADLYSMATAGVVSISLKAAAAGQLDPYGNPAKSTATLNRTVSGVTYQTSIIDARFAAYIEQN